MKTRTMVTTLHSIKESLKKYDYMKVVELANSLKATAPVFESDIEAIKKSIENKDFGNCEQMISSLLEKCQAIEQLSKREIKDNINWLIDIGGICAPENMGFSPQTDKEWADYHFNEAKMYENLNQWDKVELSLKKVLTFNKAHFNSLSKLIKLYKQFGEIDKGLELISNFISNFDGDAKSVLNIQKSQLNLSKNQLEKSLLILNDLIAYYEASPSHHLRLDAHLMRAAIYVMNNNFEMARIDFKIVNKHKPELIYQRPDALLNYALSNDEISIEEKIKHLEKSVEMMPQWEHSNYYLGILLKREKLFSKALKHFLVAHSQNISNVVYIEQVVDCLNEVNDKNRLKEFLLLGIKLGSENCKHNYSLTFE